MGKLIRAPVGIRRWLSDGALVQRERGTHMASAVQLLCLGSICHDVGIEQFWSWNPCADLPDPLP